MGRAGIVMGLEVSRLARNNADWHRLLEICALADTLILDEDGVYDPANFNDRLLLGLKGTMSEAELHVLKARLRGGILNKVRRGEYRCVLPTGFVYDEAGNVVLDPDAQIRETIAHFFETFSRVGSACQTVKVFRDEGLAFPSRLRNREATIFRPLTASTAMRTLHNPRYAGAYAYGRRRYRRAADGKKKCSASAQCSEWLACIPNAHPGYITWERFQENLKLLETNGRGYEVARASPPREGAALLQGRAVCGRCGNISASDTRRGAEGWRHGTSATARTAIAREPNCQSIAGPPIDEAIGALVAEKMTPAAVELALEIRREIESRYEEADQLRLSRDREGPDRRGSRAASIHAGGSRAIVSSPIRSRPNGTTSCAHWPRRERNESASDRRTELVLDEAIRERLVAMTTDFKQLWADPDTPNRERKRMLAYIIEDVTLIKLPQKEPPRSMSASRGADRDAHDGESQVLGAASEDAAEDRRARRQAARRPHLLRDRRPTQRARTSSRRIGSAAAAAMPVSPPCESPISSTLWAPLALRSTSRPRNVDEGRGGGTLGHPRGHAHPMGGARHRHEARLQRPRVPV